MNRACKGGLDGQNLSGLHQHPEHLLESSNVQEGSTKCTAQILHSRIVMHACSTKFGQVSRMNN